MPNDSVENGEKYFLRIKGRVVGPYTIKQLNTLRVRGQFSQSNEISSDGQNWESAAILESVFGAAKKTKREVDIETQESPSVQPGEWHYSIDGDQYGPATTATINQMMERGEFGPEDLLWKEGMDDWTPISEVSEFKSAFNFAKGRSSKRNKRATKTKPHEEIASESTHFFDLVLSFIKSQFDGSSVGGFRTSLIEFGHYTAYVCILLNAAFCFTLAIKSKSLDLGLCAVAGIFVGLALQYAAIKFCYAIRNLLLATKFPMSSRTFFDVMSVTFAIGGIVLFIFCSVQAIRENSFVPLLFGFAALVACFRIAIDSLFPEAIGFIFKKEIRVGEEGLSVFAYFALLPVRIVAPFFSMGVAISSLGVLVTFFFFFSNDRSPGGFQMPVALVAWFVSLYTAFVSLTAPMLGYVYFVLAFVSIEVLRSVLDVSPKLDLINRSLEKEPEANELQDSAA